MNRAFWLLLFLLAAGCVSTSVLNAQQAGSSPPQTSAALPGSTAGQYAANDVCKTCHQDIWDKHFAGTPHSALLKGKQHGCQDCHGPAQAHVDAGGDPTKIIRFETLSPAQSAAICLKCHQSSLETQNFATSVHLSNGLSCTTCHNPHNFKDVNFLLVKSQTDLCFSCHSAQKAEFSRPFRHRVDVGLIQCSDCHNPHGTIETRDQVRTAAGQFPICTKCHTDTMGPFVFEHASVRTENGCLNCHVPHGSTNPRLLQVNNVNFLCLRCHTVNMNGAAPGAPSFHNQATKYQACTMCHTQIHGSNFSPFFFQ